MEEPNEEEKIGDAINGGKPLEDIGNGEVIGTVVGDTRGEAGDPENGVKDVGGVVDPPGCTPKNPPPGEAIEGGEAGDEGLPLPVPPIGGLMRFSFCRRLQNQTRTTSFSILRESAT